MTNELQTIADYMANLRWKREVNYGGEVSFVRRDDEYSVALRAGYFEVCRFTDADRDGVAVGRFEAIADGETLMELIAALRELPRMLAPVAKPAARLHPIFAEICNGLFVQVGKGGAR